MATQSVPNGTISTTTVADNGHNMFARQNATKDCRLSVVIPNRNGKATIGRCLEALLESTHDSYEIIVVDDCSEDNSVEIINKYPCKLVQLPEHRGAAAARNLGALKSRGEILFFTDNDCLVQPQTLTLAEKAVKERVRHVIGGTYTCTPSDRGFFNLFQSVFIHFSETKNSSSPDYIATHAMAMNTDDFKKSAGFDEHFLPILEDVEFSHRLRRSGYRLQIRPDIQVRHIFNYSFIKSLRNAFKKSRFWTIYSLFNGDLLVDSGTASYELKLDVALFMMLLPMAVTCLFLPGVLHPAAMLVPITVNLIAGRRLLRLYYATGGPWLALSAGLYYMLVYPVAVGAGVCCGMINRKAISIAARRRK